MIAKVWLLDTGFCTASMHHMVQGEAKKIVRCHAPAVLLEHPEHGLLLFDTGYAPRVLEAFKVFPFVVYGFLTPTTTHPEWSVVAQLKNLGFAPDDVGHVIVSHLHADHIGGLLDFPKAKLVVHHDALGLLAKRGFAALKHGFLPMLAPNDFAERAQVISSFEDAALGPFVGTHDLFGDGSVRLLPLPGHARGQMGAWVKSGAGEMLLASDGCWLSQSYRQNKGPAGSAMLIFDDAKATLQTIQNLHRFAEQARTWIVPTHCPEVAALTEPGQPRRFDAASPLPSVVP